jgi:hypothetical protein
MRAHQRRVTFARAVAIAAILATAAIGPLAGCRRAPAVDASPEASALYRAAWTKRMQGDEAGYRAGLADVLARHPTTRAGRRAREMLTGSMRWSNVGESGLGRFVSALTATTTDTTSPVP